MACVAHQQQGLFVAFSSRHLLWSKRLKLKQCLSKCHLIGRADWHYILSVGPPHICGSKLKPLKISGFQGSARSDDSVTSANGLQVPNPMTSVRLDENGEVKSKFPKANNVPLSCASEANENLAVSSGIHKLIKKWHTMLHTLPPNQGEEEILGEPPTDVLPNSLQGTQKTVKGQSLKAAWSYFLALDATIKIPFLIFAPFYLAVNAVYGAEVSKDLTPLWVLGPLIVALFIMMGRWLCALYVFSFKQTIKVIKNLPSYFMLAYSYVFCGKLKGDFDAHILQPTLSITNTDYKQLGRKKLKELSEWIVEKYLDFVESIWPYYCRTIRFLKRANLI
ncbi:hypothetical protein PHAVU_003G202200 [Phaseolus vulgaris]|uniref:Uncharacterized protein n=1 Tax=Phaseolus vulgaris TaxID=3885 RepID=V7CEU7_PHAVU|nr:hypothetical protein PHAVU_003G202200g [Phaseolus vulgaris]ESW27441.1 hypothetical protein PHAVU_003G202200g [Phaseolus vulgaris]